MPGPAEAGELSQTAAAPGPPRGWEPETPAPYPARAHSPHLPGAGAPSASLASRPPTLSVQSGLIGRGAETAPSTSPPTPGCGAAPPTTGGKGLSGPSPRSSARIGGVGVFAEAQAASPQDRGRKRLGREEGKR